MKLTSVIRILEHGTCSGARPAELVISGCGDENECRETEALLLNICATPDTMEAGRTDSQQPQERHCSQDHQALAIDRVRHCPDCGVITH